MTHAKASLPRVLIVAHDARATGGVNNFLRIMRRRLRGRIDATRFSNGPRHGEKLKGKTHVLARMAWDYIRFAGLLLQRRFDVVHINPTFDMRSMPRELVFVWLTRAFSPRTKIILFFRGWDWKAVQATEESSLKKALFQASLKRVDRVLLLSETFKSSLVELGVPADRVFRTTTMFEGAVLKEVLAENPPKELRTILFLCRFMPAKGGLVVIEAFTRVAETYPDARLVMAGDGPQRAELEAAADASGVGNRIEFTGYVGGVRKMSLLASAGLFVLPTTHPEGMPNAILEAMAAGEVILTTAVGGIADVVIDQENGAILKGQDTDELTDVLTGYLSDPAKTLAVGAHNRQLAWSNWESQIVSDDIGDHYVAVVSSAAA